MVEEIYSLPLNFPFFLFQTNEKVLQLIGNHTKLFFVSVTESTGKEFKLMKRKAGRPSATNLVHFVGLGALSADPGVFAQKSLVLFCPEAISPSNTVAEEATEGSMLIRENGLCGKSGLMPSKRVMGSGAAAGAAAPAFADAIGGVAKALSEDSYPFKKEVN